ncbi:hypothetical protein [Polaromonas naphthalenivorans]|uniref:Uncharacterized protein n=1 Tax=Polaromonas naphthalenivorans (strain CJ2) TaxID=365044 RepID=A1VTA6_POLNA|nr:hypothetical protein [Polaromonas naphthalenivorans]ABM38884.1 hypothetical protein Pnap_3588 [Polaromonas naphthalenivorans CJ2]
MKKRLLVSALSLAGLLAAPAWAESTYTSPATTGSTATARLDFTVTIPQVLFLRVGTSSGNAATDGTIDGITYTVPAANVGDASVIAGVGGDLTAGAVTVRTYGNGGNISLNSTTTGPLTTGTAGEVIPWSQISVAAAPLASTTTGFTNAAITHPAFNLGTTGGAGTVTTLAATNKVVRVEGKWTYSYLNTNSVAAGTYGGTVAKNGRVTYTATQL